MFTSQVSKHPRNTILRRGTMFSTSLPNPNVSYATIHPYFNNGFFAIFSQIYLVVRYSVHPNLRHSKKLELVSLKPEHKVFFVYKKRLNSLSESTGPAELSCYLKVKAIPFKLSRWQSSLRTHKKLGKKFTRDENIYITPLKYLNWKLECVWSWSKAIGLR